jgi:hypothetical protein
VIAFATMRLVGILVIFVLAMYSFCHWIVDWMQGRKRKPDGPALFLICYGTIMASAYPMAKVYQEYGIFWAFVFIIICLKLTEHLAKKLDAIGE